MVLKLGRIIYFYIVQNLSAVPSFEHRADIKYGYGLTSHLYAVSSFPAMLNRPSKSSKYVTIFVKARDQQHLFPFEKWLRDFANRPSFLRFCVNAKPY